LKVATQKKEYLLVIRRDMNPAVALLTAAAVSLVMNGCATTGRSGAFPTTLIHGARYIALDEFCNARSVTQSYDPMTRVAALTRANHQARIVVDDTFILIDGQPHQLPLPIEYSKGSVYIPDQFRRDVLDGIFDYQPAVISDYRGQGGFGKIKKVVIDAGHGGRDPGATGRTGVREKEVTLDIARKLADLLNAEGVQTVLVRSGDQFVPLEGRVQVANHPGNSIFVSIHANANPSRSMKGFEVYYMTPRISDTDRALASARTERLDLDGSFAGTPSMSLKGLLWDMIYSYNRAESISLSRSICKVSECRLDTRVIGVKNANYHVLRGAAIPAVLVEVGFLSNPSEEKMLSDGQYRQRIAEAIKEGIRDFGQSQDDTGGNNYAAHRGI
jgi:N-acetylmuramoyl-L-alanine amidase